MSFFCAIFWICSFIVSNWYVGAVVGFALGTLKGDLTTASIGLVIGATVSWIFKKCLMSKK